MLVIPAIDLKDGKVVRLLQGRYTEPIVYSHDPLTTAKTWQKEGARRLHIIDLDGALAGEPRNTYVLRDIIKGLGIPVQVGGGLRTKEDIAAILSMGAKWVILGTKACEDVDFVKNMLDEFGEQIIISIDAKFRKVAARGWTELTQVEDATLIKQMKTIGAQSFIYTDISRDGTLAGPDTQVIKKVLEETGTAMFYSGGISSSEDVKKLLTLKEQGLAGIIIGKALYEDKVHLGQVIRIVGGDFES